MIYDFYDLYIKTKIKQINYICDTSNSCFMEYLSNQLLVMEIKNHLIQEMTKRITITCTSLPEFLYIQVS